MEKMPFKSRELETRKTFRGETTREERISQSTESHLHPFRQFMCLYGKCSAFNYKAAPAQEIMATPFACIVVHRVHQELEILPANVLAEI